MPIITITAFSILSFISIALIFIGFYFRRSALLILSSFFLLFLGVNLFINPIQNQTGINETTTFNYTNFTSIQQADSYNNLLVFTGETNTTITTPIVSSKTVNTSYEFEDIELLTRTVISLFYMLLSAVAIIYGIGLWTEDGD